MVVLETPTFSTRAAESPIRISRAVHTASPQVFPAKTTMDVSTLPSRIVWTRDALWPSGNVINARRPAAPALTYHTNIQEPGPLR